MSTINIIRRHLLPRSRRGVLFLLALLLALPLIPATQITTVEAQGCYLRTDWPVYVVQRGDSLSVIARRVGTTLYTLMSANCITNPNRLYVGQRLFVPRLPGGGPGPGNSYEVPITYQFYEGGFMVFRADNGEIMVFASNGGYFRSFPSYTYGGLRDNPIPNVPPANRWKPIMGFGKVWGNFKEVRDRLGWGVDQERSFQSRYIPEAAPNRFTLTLPGSNGGVRVFYGAYGNLNWVFTGVYNPPTPIPQYPTPTYTPSPAPAPYTVWSAYQLFENGQMVWFSHTGAIIVLINDGRFRQFDLAQYGGLPDNPILAPTPRGLVRPISGFGRVWGNFLEIAYSIGWATLPEQGFNATVDQNTASGYRLSLPDGRRVLINYRDGRWTYEDGSLPPISSVTGFQLDAPQDATATPLPTQEIPQEPTLEFVPVQ